jgi:hypothetical protein
MNHRNLYWLSATIGVLSSACAGKPFSSSTEPAEIGGQSTSSIGGSASEGGGSSAGGNSNLGGASSDSTSGGASATGGRRNIGGFFPNGGRVTTGGTQTNAGSTSTLAWTCDRAFFDSQTGCDCGCAQLDPDCAQQVSRDACIRANNLGACSRATGWGLLAIDPTDNTRCVTAPSGWTCAPSYYGDGICHCGCGIRDSDCSRDASDVCQSCGAQGSCAQYDWSSTCEAIDASKNSACVPAQHVTGWTCAPGHYGSADGCDCGCGVADPDCANGRPEACDRCDDDGACSHFVGCDLLSEGNNAKCVSGEWTCDPRRQGDGICDCGCGRQDQDDCADGTSEACGFCGSPGSCARNCDDISPNVNQSCSSGWG